jgi:hypothetical protein
MFMFCGVNNTHSSNTHETAENGYAKFHFEVTAYLRLCVWKMLRFSPFWDLTQR